jgi:hypothetical protein
MTIQTPDTGAFATTFAIPCRSPAAPPPSILMWMIEALVLGPDRDAPADEETPGDRTRRRRADQRREDPRDAVHG